MVATVTPAFLVDRRWDEASKHHVGYVGIRCRKCPRVDWRQSSSNPGWARRTFGHEGWAVGDGPNKHICPDCLRPAHKPRHAPPTLVVSNPTPPQMVVHHIKVVPEPTPVTALAEALAPMKEALERKDRVRRSRGSTGGFGYKGNASVAAKAVLREPPFNIANPKLDVHFRAEREAEGTFRYVLLGASTATPPLKPQLQETPMNDTAQDRRQAVLAEPPPKPTLADNRRIREMLDAVYDENKQRYIGTGNDTSIASTLGLPRRWISDMRELLYGPDGNEQAELAIKAKTADLSVAVGLAEKALKLGNSIIDQIGELETVRAELKQKMEKLK